MKVNSWGAMMSGVAKRILADRETTSPALNALPTFMLLPVVKALVAYPLLEDKRFGVAGASGRT